MPSSVSIQGDSLICGASDLNALIAFDKKDGSELFRNVTGFWTFSSPAVSGNTAYIGSYNGRFFAFDISENKVKWVLRNEKTSSYSKNILNNNGGGYNYDNIADLDFYTYNGNVEMVNRLYAVGSVLSSPLVNDGVVYFTSTDSCIYAVTDGFSGIKAESKEVLLGKIQQKADTGIYLVNSGTVTGKFAASFSDDALTENVSISADTLTIMPNDSAYFNLSIDPLKLAVGNYMLGIKFSSLTSSMFREYTRKYSFEIPTVLTAIESDINNGISAYPNPAEKNIIFELPDHVNNAFVRIFNSRGVKVHQAELGQKHNWEFSYSQFPASGIYYYEIITSLRKYRGKIMIK